MTEEEIYDDNRNYFYLYQDACREIERLNWLLQTKCQSEWERENEELKKENKENLHYLTCMTEQRNKLKIALEKIQKIFSEPCIEGENCFTCNSNCSNKDVLNITTEVLK